MSGSAMIIADIATHQHSGRYLDIFVHMYDASATECLPDILAMSSQLPSVLERATALDYNLRHEALYAYYIFGVCHLFLKLARQFNH
jgi:hypothetical protein